MCFLIRGRNRKLSWRVSTVYILKFTLDLYHSNSFSMAKLFVPVKSKHLRLSDCQLDYLSELIWNAVSVHDGIETKSCPQVVCFVIQLWKDFWLSLWSGTVHSYSKQLCCLNCFRDKNEASCWYIQDYLLFVLRTLLTEKFGICLNFKLSAEILLIINRMETRSVLFLFLSVITRSGVFHVKETTTLYCTQFSSTLRCYLLKGCN